MLGRFTGNTLSRIDLHAGDASIASLRPLKMIFRESLIIFEKLKTQIIMKKPLFCILLFITFIGVHAQNKTATPNPDYDAALAKKLGADEYGMKQYVMAFLKDGPNRITDSVKRADLQRAHLKNIIRLANEGKLLIAGPFLDGKEVEGIFIFNVATIEEAKALTETDPAIKAGSLVMELRPWYGSAALVEVLSIHKKLEKKSVADF
jgi:uncharacterized protein YciI